MDINKILERINYHGPLDVNLDVLRALQHAWLFAVPFENLDIHANVKIVLDPDRFYEKIVLNRRGGFCYEGNTLFYHLLKHTGFDVSILAARMAIYDNPPPGFSHMALQVTLDQPYLVDVSNGQSVRDPMSIPSDIITHAEGIDYRVGVYADEGYALYYKQEKKGWLPRYVFALTPRGLDDFNDTCVYHQTSPESAFTKQRLCTLPTKNGRITLTGNILSIRDNGAETRITLDSGAEMEAVLRKYFNIEATISTL